MSTLIPTRFCTLPLGPANSQKCYYATTVRKKRSIAARPKLKERKQEVADARAPMEPEESFNTQSLNYQKETLMRELEGRDQGEGEKLELWPKRRVMLDLEFPNVSQERISALKKEGWIKDDNPIAAAMALQRRKSERTEVKKLDGMKRKELARPEWHRQTVTIDSLNVEKKLELPASLRETKVGRKIGSSGQERRGRREGDAKDSAMGDASDQESGEVEYDAVVESLPEGETDRASPAKAREVPSFHDLGVTYPSLLQTLATKWNITVPTDIQVLAIPEALKGSHLFIADQTGMGKSLAYILPMLMRLKELEARPAFRRRGQRSRAIILVPTRELVEQLVRIVQACMEGTPEFSHMRVLGMAGGVSTDKKEQMGFTPGLDVMVTTGDRLSFHLDKLHFNLDDTKIFIVDEADTVFSIDTLKIQLLNFVYKLETSTLSNLGFPLQHIWVSATVSQTFGEFVSQKFPQTVQAFHPNVHTAVQGLRQHFIFGRGDFKPKTLLETLQKNKGKRAMIFCNSIDTCKNVYQLLHTRGYNASLAISDLASRKRAQNFQQFSDGETQILISTDLASRGIDTVALIDHVILYDFPQNVIDYIHRIGRTARSGKRGLATSFIGKWDQALAQKIRTSFEQGASLSAVTTRLRSIEKKHKKFKLDGKISPLYLDKTGQVASRAREPFSKTRETYQQLASQARE